MGLHIATLISGVAVGALVIYITKDEDAREAMERFIDGSGDTFKALLRRITPEKTGDIPEGRGRAIAAPEKEASGESTASPPKEQPADSDKAVH